MTAHRRVVAWLALLLCLGLPLRGFAAMGGDTETGHGTTAATVHLHDQSGVDADGESAMDHDCEGDAQSVHHTTCSVCCCMVAIDVDIPQWIPDADESRIPTPFVERIAPSARVDGLERPPRTVRV